jgi:hypothetical protein
MERQKLSGSATEIDAQTFAAFLGCSFFLRDSTRQELRHVFQNYVDV